MKSVWVIEEGSYSDYRVVGVFSTQERAQKMLSLVKNEYSDSNAAIAEWTLDPEIEELNGGLSVYQIVMDIDGNTEKIDKQDISSYVICSIGLRVWERTCAPRWDKRRVTDAVSGFVWAEDETHAMKIANEFRARAIADGKMYRRD